MNTRFFEIDLLRFLSALGVVIFHYTYTAVMEGYAPVADFESLRVATRYAYMGINFFFIISGFVIFMSVADGCAKKFLISRFVRLFPAYWAALIITSIVTVFWGGEVFSVSWPQFFANTTMVNEALNYKPIDGAYWTLYIELKFYLFILALLLLGWLKHFQHIIALVLALSLIALYTPWASNINMFTAMFPHWSGYFATGCIFYLLKRDGVNWYRMSLLVLAYCYVLKQSVLFGDLMGQWFQLHFNSTTIVLLNTLFFALFCLTAFCQNNPLRQSWCYYLGILTYPLYLIHQHLGYIIFNTLGNKDNIQLMVIITIGVMLFIAFMLHKYIEIKLAKPLNNWLKQRFLTR
ncbi:acyltransferase [Thalassotalea insulae]|uniref:Acyltransferase n=1 Tax=Thalassotalea insulae TaxID=2056778 RepID=A0ABQ6GW30_9GAMM|nr:acyltransferase [Thalassotalea insulae]GLX78381.1 acyltransferase [Thalassotalea insulae]